MLRRGDITRRQAGEAADARGDADTDGRAGDSADGVPLSYILTIFALAFGPPSTAAT